MKKCLLSFIGTNDAGILLGKTEGAIITALKNETFDEVKLLWNDSVVNENLSYADIMIHLKREIKKQKLCSKIDDEEFELTDVTDHNEIYKQLKAYSESLPKDKNIEYTAAISSGTPAMQVCWILLAESGDFSEQFPLRLIKVKDPKFGKSKNIEVKLNTALPKIIGLKKEVGELKKNLIPLAEIETEKGELKIGETKINLSPVELCYYRYFADRVAHEEKPERFSGINVPLEFIKKIFAYHEETFPDLELNRAGLKDYIKKGYDFPIQTFRGHISKINRKLKEGLNNETVFQYFKISYEGRRGAKFYGIKAPAEKLLFKK